VDVTVAGRNIRQRAGVCSYRVAALDSRDVRLRGGLPVTAPARTLIDFAGRHETGDDELLRAVSEARVQRVLSDSELTAAMTRCATRAGVARLRALLAQAGERIGSRHEAERRLIRLIVQARLPMPETNVRLLGHEVDLLWRSAKLVIEMDGWAFHGHRAAFERDRDRDQKLVAAGYRVIRVTWRQLEREPLAVVARIAQALQISATVAA
jgi:very-short-patch-repair endonuclease